MRQRKSQPSVFCSLAAAGSVFVAFYYIASLFIGPVNETTVQDTEGVDLAKSPLRVNLTNNSKALAKLEEFKQVNFANLRAKQQEALLREYIPLIGVNGILDVLEHDAEMAHERCHNQAHSVGITATWITDDLEFLMDVIQDRCDSAAFHGVVEAKLLSIRSTSKNKDLKQLAPHVFKICTHPSVMQIFDSGACAQGIGYAFMMMDSSFYEAVDACFEVSKFSGIVKANEKKQNWAFYCSEGVFKNYLYNYCDCSSLLEPCISHPLSPGACWVYKFTEMMLDQDPSSKDKKFQICKSLSKEKQPACFYGYGYYVSSFSDSLDLQSCMNKDLLLDSQLACVDGFFSRAIVSIHGDEIQKYCHVVVDSMELFNKCQEVAAGAIFSMTKDVSKYVST